MEIASTDPSIHKLLDNGRAEPPYGSRLLPNVVDELANTDPTRVYATIPLSSDISQGFRDVTMLEVAQSVDHFAFWLETSFGRSSSFETLAYMGIPDLRYAILFLAAVKCGYKLLVPSIRNSNWMNLSLLQQTGCVKFLHTFEMSPKVRELQAERESLRAIAVSSLGDMTHQGSKHYPYKASFEKNRWDPVLILHSSGSTGPPKPIETNHATWAVADNDRNLPQVKGRRTQSYALWNFDRGGGRYFAAFPPFHLGGFMALVVLPIYSTTATVVLAPADKPPTGHLACQIMQQYQLRALFCPPTIFEQVVQEPEGLELAKQLNFLLYAGGPLSTNTGDLLSQVTDVCQFYGSTETGAVPALVPRREDWASLEWHPSYVVDMQPSEDNAYEMVLHRDPKLQGIRSLSCNFLDVEEWHTRDLFRPQPGKPNLWRFHGRRDDIIVLSNGEKFNPVPSEAIIAGHHLLSAALIAGLGRFQAALLMEPKAGNETEKIALIDTVWPTVEHANAQAPGHARIIRSMIAVADIGKHFERAAKGTVIRKMTLEKFAPEIEALYLKNNLGVHGPRLAATHNLEAIHEYVRACIDFSFAAPSLDEDDDLYVLGLDSLKTMEIAGMLKVGLGNPDTSWLSAQTVYANPTIQSLSKFIQKRLNPESEPSDGDDDHEQLRVSKMAALVDKYTRDLPGTVMTKRQLLQSSKPSVVLTGSTGSLGTHLLRSLLDGSRISKIYCLNRSADAREEQVEAFRRLRISQNLDSPKIEFIRVEYGQGNLGLAEAKFRELTANVDIIIHNAWKVDFNQSLESFEPVHIRGVRNLIDWSISSSRHPHILFISSVSSVGNQMNVQSGEQVAETPISDHHSAQKMGYGESKNVAECILNIANNKSGVPVSILRVGQIAGPVTVEGIWNTVEWFPSLIKTSQSLGCLPNYLPDADWIPVDNLAEIILDIVHFAVDTGHARIYNIVNPKSTVWTTLIATVLSRLGRGVEVVELSAWIQLLSKSNKSNAREVTAKPAAKILDFYRDFEAGKQVGGLKYSTAHGIAASSTMAELESVNAQWMNIWLDQWGY